ncbi:MAG: FtsQ-type POTRA domain-containing protein [Emcibacteraceae bacterium]|jgi:cell division protein FtsQ|uniref:cell division protein FtsQ/DivIB n=1 Tax=Pseudemcibacter sp. TaxID=2943293 RepID=UPI0023225323|nr:FtsQ-type POTRA domain-containing protein [Kordiimonadaceae bacterium]MDA7568663.1 FtsQ-type POTRA domain-containing protein [Emcibacteraceae bacterium]MDC1090072.1 FtsQ-type POTRA domain-containing protein [Emcibacteraceae bacterium]MDG1020782.1 FtsQ-type POTRA domain-containing protein [Emcibacteraceae bacterium]MDG1727549.1 FtsQ-type POTRA domain-containing protein [Emcibacteraceae bacterium]
MRAVRDDVKYNKPSGRRGEQEAKNLKRRRLLNSVLRGLSVTAVCLVVILSLYLWRSGQITTWINSAENKVEDSLVDAGITVDQIIIEGAFQTPKEVIYEASGVTIGEPLLATNINAIKDQVEQLTWIKVATISRRLPDGVLISVEEHRPAALWQLDNKLWVLSDEGVRITDLGLEAFADLPMISGIGADQALERLLNAVSQNIDLFNRVETASWIGGRRWDLILKNGIKIMLPEEDMNEAWQNLIEFERDEKLLARNILAVDFRIKDKTVVRLTPEEAARRRLIAKTSGKGEEI